MDSRTGGYKIWRFVSFATISHSLRVKNADSKSDVFEISMNVETVAKRCEFFIEFFMTALHRSVHRGFNKLHYFCIA
jgi:hypothetical protein